LVLVVTFYFYICATQKKNTLYELHSKPLCKGANRTNMSTWFVDYSKLVDTVRPRTFKITRRFIFLLHVPIIVLANLLYPRFFRNKKRKQGVKKSLKLNHFSELKTTSKYK